MTVQLALTAALSGLRTAQQQAALVSHNIANATTDGYVKRDLALSAANSAGEGDGVQVNAVTRNVDELLIRDARFATSRYTGQETRASALADYAQVLGQPQDETSVSSRLAALRQAFTQLYNMPNDDAAQSAVVSQATALAQALNSASNAAQTVRDNASDQLSTSVDAVNAALHKISDLNGQIAGMEAVGGDSGDLRDERDRLLDQVSEEIGIRTYSRDNGEVVVMTRNGQTLLDGEMDPHEDALTLIGNDVMVNGVSLSDHPDTDIQSGRIMGYVQTITVDMPKAQAQLDELAAGLVRGFQQAEADPTQAGLFTDAGAAYGATAGLASRIAVNDAVTGAAWKVQSGVQATTALDAGDQTQIAKFQAVFTATRSFAATDMPSSTTLTAYATAMVSTQQGYRTTAETAMSTLKISADTLQSARINRDGVNMDDEMARLQLIEQSYGASAQVIQVAGQMIDILLQMKV